MPKVSVCIPVYNNASQLKRALVSVLNQSYGDYEIVITDDSDNDEIFRMLMEFDGLKRTEDGTEKLMGQGGRNSPENASKNDIKKDGNEPAAFIIDRRYQVSSNDRFLFYRHNPERLGPVFNWNECMRMASGEYIKLLFSDDWFRTEESLGKFVSMLEDDPEVGMAFSGSDQVDEEGNSRIREASQPFLERMRRDYRELFLGNEIGTPSATIFRRCSAEFDPRSNWASDMFLYFEILAGEQLWAMTPEPLICVGEHEGQYTHTFKERDERKFRDYLLMYEKYGLDGCEACRRYFKEAFLLPYYKSVRFAAGMGYDWKEYRRELIKYAWEHKVMDYFRAFKRKICCLIHMNSF